MDKTTKRSILLKIIFWEYPRGSWQYDLMVIAILAFTLLSPREWFRDQPRSIHPNDIIMLPAEGELNVFWLEPELLADTPAEQRQQRAAELLRQRTGHPQNILRLEPIFNAENELRGYMAFAKPLKKSSHRTLRKESSAEKSTPTKLR